MTFDSYERKKKKKNYEIGTKVKDSQEVLRIPRCNRKYKRTPKDALRKIQICIPQKTSQ